MPQSLDPDLLLFLRETAKAWIEKDPGHRNGKQLHRLSGVSHPQIGDLLRGKTIGYQTAIRLGTVFGWSRISELEHLADAWSARTGIERPSTKLTDAPAKLAGLPRLRDRLEWNEVLADARAATDGLGVLDEAWERIGRCVDGEAWPSPLSARLIEEWATALDRELKRRARG